MDPAACNTTEKVDEKSKLIEFMEQNNISYNLLECQGCEKFCIDFSSKDNTCKKHCCKSGIIVQTSGRNACRIYPHEIMYIAIENRKSVLYLTSGRVETSNQLDYWKGILDSDIFAQPHHSFIVNLNYVEEVTKDFVKVKNGNKEYSVYTSLRKIGSFKKAFLKFGKH